MSETLDAKALLRLQNWMSPVFPIGSFAYSSGLERAVHDGSVRTPDDLWNWLQALLAHGSPWNDAVFLSQTWRTARKQESLNDLIGLATAMNGSRERYLETTAQGEAFISAVDNWPLPEGFKLPESAPLPVAIGAVCGVLQIPLKETLLTFLQAFINNQLQAAIRLSVLGQNGAAQLLASLEPLIIETAQKASHSTLDDLGSAAFLADIALMNHEVQQTRLFRS